MGTESVQLRDVLRVLRRRWLVIATTVVIAVALAVGLSLIQEPTYVASADVVLEPSATTTGVANEVTPEQVATEAQSVTSQAVAEQVLEETGIDESVEDLIDTITVEPDPDGAAVLTISATRGDADEAADVANGFAEAYLVSGSDRAAAQVAAVQKTMDRVAGQISDITNQLADPTIPNRADLVSERAALQAQRDLLAQTLAQLSINTAPSGEVATSAVAPGAPASPQPLRNAILAGVLGLLLGTALAFLRDYFDDRVRDEGALRQALGGRSVLGRVPHLKQGQGRLTMLAEPHGTAAEAYRELGVNVRFLLAAAEPGATEPGSTPAGSTAAGPGAGASGADRGPIVLFASATPEEGKTSTSANLAVVVAMTGLRTVLVDADLRRPRVAPLFDVAQGPGLSDALAHRLPLDQVLHRTSIETLRVLPAGTSPPNPAELLASAAMRDLVRELSGVADLVIIDSPALLAASDALELVPLVDLCVLVARGKFSRKRSVARAMQMIEQVGGNVPGSVLNDVKATTSKASAYYGV